MLCFLTRHTSLFYLLLNFEYNIKALLYFIWIMYRYILKVKKELHQTRIFDRVEVLHLLKRLRKCCGRLRLIFHNTHNMGSNNPTYSLSLNRFLFFFSIRVFFHEHSRFKGQQGKREVISLTPLYHFHTLHRHLDIRR